MKIVSYRVFCLGLPPRLADLRMERRLIMGDYRLRDLQAGKLTGNDTIHFASPEAEGAAPLNDSNDKQKALDSHLRAAAQLSAELSTESQLQGQNRDREVQTLQDQLRASQQRNTDLERQLDEQAQLRRHAGHQAQMLQNRLDQRVEQLHNTQNQLQDTQRHLEDSRLYAKRLEESQRQTIAHINQHQQLSMEIQELDAQRTAKSSMRQQCINNIAKQGFFRIEGLNGPSKRPAAAGEDHQWFKRPCNN
ncbi:hypothetical protein FGADI_11440 [Fusarium gaditjirri]|uniref:Uncharacterized protein n=1 Tax=Fusarium gaditjirri TaxID=282569 RepID=A0A8H4WQ92_9HYPO|nr:hypothetical protein FGADI_11440 [Fusarium gaditjirri]